MREGSLKDHLKSQGVEHLVDCLPWNKSRLKVEVSSKRLKRLKDTFLRLGAKHGLDLVELTPMEILERGSHDFETVLRARFRA